MEPLKIVIPESLQSTQEILSLQNNPLLDCPVCDGVGLIHSESEGYKSERICECAKISARKKYLGERFYDIKLEDIKPQNVRQKNLKSKLIENPSKSIFLSGEVRTGKTHFLAAMFVWWHKKSTRIKYLDDQTLKDELRNAELNNDFSFVYDLVKDNDHIFIDDVGKSSMSEFHRGALHRFFNEIYKNNRHIFITSNDPLSVLGSSEYWGKAIARRIEDLCEIVEF